MAVLTSGFGSSHSSAVVLPSKACWAKSSRAWRWVDSVIAFCLMSRCLFSNRGLCSGRLVAYYRPEQRQQQPLPLETLQRWEEQCLVQANYRPVDLTPIKGHPLQYRLVKNGWVYRVSWDAQQLRCRTGSLGRLEEGPSPLVSSHGFRLEQDQLIETVRLGGSRGASARYATRRYLPVTADNPKKER